MKGDGDRDGAETRTRVDAKGETQDGNEDGSEDGA